MTFLCPVSVQQNRKFSADTNKSVTLTSNFCLLQRRQVSTFLSVASISFRLQAFIREPNFVTPDRDLNSTRFRPYRFSSNACRSICTRLHHTRALRPIRICMGRCIYKLAIMIKPLTIVVLSNGLCKKPGID